MSKAIQCIENTLPIPVDGLKSYIQQINAIPLLTAEEEQELALRYHHEGDLQAAQQLVLSHLRYVVKVAHSYAGYGLPVADLIQEGTIGLMKAVKRFDPTVGVRLVSFAVHWIKAEIHEFVIRNWRLVKIATTKAQRKLFFNIRQSKKRLGWFTKDEVETVAHDLGVTPEEVQQMEARLNAHDMPIDATPEDEENHHVAPIHYLAGATSEEPEQIVIEANTEDRVQEALQQALTTLDPRSLDIIQKRWLSDKKAPLKELAETYQISMERVRQIEAVAIQQLKDAVDI